MSFACGTYSVMAEGPDGQQVALPLRCRQWDCPTCGPRQRKRLIARFVAGNPDALLTLTCNPEPYENREAAFRGLSVALNHLFKRIRRRYPHNTVQYALVWETTKKGWPHAHILLRAPFIPHAWLSQIWKDLVGAKVVDIRGVTSGKQVARYVAKYITKAPECPPGMKRYRTSRQYSPTQSPTRMRDLMELTPFLLTPQTVSQIDAAWRRAGLHTTTWLNFILIGYAGPRPPPGRDLDLDNPFLPLEVPAGLHTDAPVSYDTQPLP